MRRIAPVLILALSTAALAAGAAGHATAGPSAVKFADLRVCGATTFSRRLSRCTHDERRLRITSNRISCSVTLVASAAGSWRVRFSYDHHVEPWRTGGTVSVGTNHLWHNTNVGTDMPVPGGNWRCDFAFRSHVASVVFRSGGPVGQIVDAAVCSDSDVLSFGRKGLQKRCARNDAGTPFTSPRRIYCSAVFAGPSSKDVKIEVLDSEGTALSTTNLKIGWPTVSQAAGSVDGAMLTSPGSYSCRVSLGNGTTVETPFQVGPTT